MARAVAIEANAFGSDSALGAVELQHTPAAGALPAALMDANRRLAAWLQEDVEPEAPEAGGDEGSSARLESAPVDGVAIAALQIKLKEDERRRELALRITGIFWRDVDFTTGEVTMTGANPELQAMLQGDLRDLRHVAAEDQAAVRREVTSSLTERRPFHVRYRLNRSDGQETFVETIGDHLFDPSGRPERLFSVIKDITAEHQAQRRIETLAFCDSLTGLGNRAHFQKEFAAAVAHAKQAGRGLGLVMIDVDHFKAVNDTMGHDTGDLLLRSLAGSMERAFRKVDTLVRLGGDEFAVIVSDAGDPAALQRPIDALRRILAEPVLHDGQSFHISASIGAALSREAEGEDASCLMKNADIALYRAKTEGRNRTVLYSPELSSGLADQLATLREVRAGIPRGEFVLYYQPLVDTVSGEIRSFEALMRWNHPQRGLLMPGAFAKAFEDADLSLQLGEIALTTALKQMSQWIEQGVEFGRVAVNVTSAQFRSGRFAEEVAAKLRLWNVPASRLTVEITENVYLGPGSHPVAEAIRALHDMGVLIALDDFGTGYASLSNLRQLAVDKLKIDRSFVQDTDDSVARAVIGLGSSLGMQVVAEGVETAEQAALLRGHGCDELQGYLYGKAMPASAIAALLTSTPVRA